MTQIDRANVIANPPCGRVAGFVVGGDVSAFLGIPYAEPPVGERRWRRATAINPWPDIRPAKRPGSFCPQYDIDGGGVSLQVPMSEDCLYLNIWTPAPDTAARPVLFYIHGGGFEAGSGAYPFYSGQWLARSHDVVVVTINYRLSIFGLPPFSPHGASEPCNLALLDQVEALRWVRDNIAAFGGDPGNVTLFGLSAGGWSIVSLLGMPEVRGLFHKAVAQSASVLSTLREDARALATRAILHKLELPDVDRERLMAADTSEILAAAEAANHAWRDELAGLGDRGRPFVPHLEACSLPIKPLESASADWAFDGPVLIGTAREEVGFNPFRAGVPFLRSYFTHAGTVAALGDMVGRDTAVAIWDGYSALYAKSEAQTGGMIRTAFDYMMPAIRFAETRSSRALTWMYQFHYPAAKVAASTHASDIIFWSGAMEPSPIIDLFFGENGIGADELALSRTMQDDLIALARSGKPGWEPYSLDTRYTKIYDLHPKILADPAAPERCLWDGVQF